MTNTESVAQNYSKIFEFSKRLMAIEKAAVLQVFEALSSGIRLEVFRLLVQAGSAGRVAGEIAAALDLPPTNLSFHLKSLLAASLVSVEQEGRFQRYRANIALMLDTISYLTANCCRDHPEECASLRDRFAGVGAFLPALDCKPEGNSKA